MNLKSLFAFSLILILFFAVACSNSTVVPTPAPTPTPEPIPETIGIGGGIELAYNGSNIVMLKSVGNTTGVSVRVRKAKNLTTLADINIYPEQWIMLAGQKTTYAFVVIKDDGTIGGYYPQE